MHITSRIYDTASVGRLIQAAEQLGFFSGVYPVHREDGVVIAVAFASKDLSGFSDEREMPEVGAALAGIVGHDIEIVSAWELSEVGEHQEYAVLVPGRSVVNPR